MFFNEFTFLETKENENENISMKFFTRKRSSKKKNIKLIYFVYELKNTLTVVFFKMRESSNFGQGVVKPRRNLTETFFNLW